MKKLVLGVIALFSMSFAQAEVVNVTCNSLWDLYTECRVDGVIERAQLVQRFSNSQCIEGESWGYRRGGSVLWVAEGCRAQFRVRLEDDLWDDSFTVRCESNSHVSRRCDTGVTNRRVVLERQLSSSTCREGRSWSWDRYSIRVNNGCRAVFRVYPR